MRLAPWIAVGGATFALLALPLIAQDKPALAPEAAPVRLPITRVTLFNAGIGYFHREGTVDGNAKVELKVNEEDVNDLILTLLANDPKGTTQAVTYDNRAPAEITLKAFSIDITENPGIGNLLMQVRGEKVDITDQNGSQLSGQIVSVGNATAETTKSVPVENIGLLTDDGLQSLPINRIKKVKFAKQELQAEFRKALEALAAARGASTKTVGVAFNGQGQRKVSVGYVSDAPLWKPTYRVVLAKDKPTIQGFAAIENTTDEDWENVRMKLVSGRPVTFKMDLYDPLFVPRPLVEPELYASLRPPMYQGIVQGNLGGGMVPLNQAGQFQGSGFGGGNALQNNLAQFGSNQANLGVGGGLTGMTGASHQYRYGGITRPSVRSLMGERLTNEALAERKNDPAKTQPSVHAPGSGVNSLGGLGESFEFPVADPVSLARFKSALVPLFDSAIEARPIAIYNPQILEGYPMKGVYLKNTTKSFFPKGPVSVYEDGGMTGQALLPDLNPGETRLMSYAIDLDTRVAAESLVVKKEQIEYRFVNERLVGRIRVRETRRYAIHNKADAVRTVWITQPIQKEWKLIAPVKPIEQTADLYRFEVAVPGKTTVHLDVVESREVDGLLDPKGSDDREGSLIAMQAEPVTVKTTPVRQWIAEGQLHEIETMKATNRYTLINLDTKPYTLPVSGGAREGWRLIEPQAAPNGPLNRYRTEAVLPAGGKIVLTVSEERERQTTTPLVNLTPERIAVLVKLETMRPAVSAALAKLSTMDRAVSDTESGAREEETAIKEIKDDQTRIRANIERVPKDSDAYKRYLKKFDDQETELENRTAKLKAHQKQLVKARAELAALISTLKAE